MPKHSDLDAALESGRWFLRSQQLVDGSFPCSAWTEDGRQFEDARAFSTMLVLVAAGEHLDATQRMRAIEFIWQSRTSEGAWGYLREGFLPEDADDTAVAVMCIGRFGTEAQRRELDIQRALGRFIRPNGRICTWNTRSGFLERPGQTSDRSTASDDLVVVANLVAAVAHFDRALASETLGNWAGWLQGAKRSELSTPYYPLSGTVEYAWNRASQAMGNRERFVPQKQPESILEAVLAVTCGVGDLTDAVLSAQGGDGSWRQECFYAAPGAQCGSQAISTALGIEAVSCQLTRRESGGGSA